MKQIDRSQREGGKEDGKRLFKELVGIYEQPRDTDNRQGGGRWMEGGKVG